MLAYDADLELFRDNFKRFMNEHIAPHYDQWEREGIMPRSVWSQLGENGFLCVDVPEEYGGYGVPTYYSLMLVEESARAGFCALSTAISVTLRLRRLIFYILGPKNKNNTGYRKW